MENKIEPSLVKSSMNYGALLGLALVIYSLILWMLDLSTSRSLGYVSYLIIIAGLFLGMKMFRDQESGGFITYGRALGLGVMISLFAAIISGFFGYIFFKFLDPGMIEKIALMAEEQLYERGMPEEQIEMALNAQKMFMKPGFLAITSFIGYVFMGFIFSLIIAIFVKKDAPPFEQTS
jgi:hypothetical protein